MSTTNTIECRDLRLFLAEERKNVAALQALDKVIDSETFSEQRGLLCHAWACVLGVWRENTDRIVRRGGLLHIGAGV